MSRPRAKIEFADALRGIAALAVLIEHYCGGFWFSRDSASLIGNFPALDPTTVPTPSYVAALFPFPHGVWGAFGVSLFFLISGFVIPFSFERYSRTGFAVARAFRLLPTYAACFTVTLIALLVSGLVFDRPFPYSASEVAIHYVPGLRDLLWSRHIDYLVWTLEVEVKFYAVCACIAPLLKRASPLAFVAPTLTIAAGLLANATIPHLASSSVIMTRAAHIISLNSQMIAFMFIGVALHYLRRGALQPVQVIGLTAILFGGFVAIWATGPSRGLIFQAIAYAAALLLFFGAARLEALVAWKALRWLAKLSYPLYAVHGVIGFILLRLLMGAGVPAWLALGAVSAIAIALAYAIHVAVEVPTQHIGRRLGSLASQFRPATEPLPLPRPRRLHQS